MTEVWALAAFWLALALIAGVMAMRYRISSAMSEVVVGTIAQLIFGATIGAGFLGVDEVLGQIPIWRRRDATYISCGRGTRTGGSKA